MIKSKLAMFRENIRMSLTNIRSNKMRTFLTILGIIIGVAAVIAMITTVSGVTGEITSQFTAMGTGKFTVTASGTVLKPGLTQADIKTLEEIDNVTGISISTSSDSIARHDGEWTDEVTMQGRNTVYFLHNPDIIARGRGITILDEEQEARVCLISTGLQEKLFYGHDPMNQVLTLDGHTFTVIGVISDSGDNDVMTQAMGNSGDEKVIVPYTTAMKMSKTAYIRSIEIYVADTDQQDDTIEKTKEALKRIFNGRDDDTFSVINMSVLLDSLNTVTGLMTTMLAGIAGISLLVGGIGIMNMMLVSVTERTMEIGLRKALGAEPGMIQMQFLIEAFILSVMGGAIGAVLGVSLSIMLCNMMDINFVISWSAIILGVSFSAIVGLVFGWAPARKASQLNPIDALRAA